MLPKSQSISVRLPQADFDFLMSISSNGARTQSEKLRELIRLVREKTLAPDDFASCFAESESKHAKTLARVRELELNAGKHSEVIELLFMIAPLLDALIAQKKHFENMDTLKDLEGLLVKQFSIFIDRFLRQAVAGSAACLDKEALAASVASLRPLLLSVINEHPNPRGEN